MRGVEQLLEQLGISLRAELASVKEELRVARAELAAKERAIGALLTQNSLLRGQLRGHKDSDRKQSTTCMELFRYYLPDYHTTTLRVEPISPGQMIVQLESHQPVLISGEALSLSVSLSGRGGEIQVSSH